MCYNIFSDTAQESKNYLLFLLCQKVCIEVFGVYVCVHVHACEREKAGSVGKRKTQEKGTGKEVAKNKC